MIIIKNFVYVNFQIKENRYRLMFNIYEYKNNNG